VTYCWTRTASSPADQSCGNCSVARWCWTGRIGAAAVAVAVVAVGGCCRQSSRSRLATVLVDRPEEDTHMRVLDNDKEFYVGTSLTEMEKLWIQ